MSYSIYKSREGFYVSQKPIKPSNKMVFEIEKDFEGCLNSNESNLSKIESHHVTKDRPMKMGLVYFVREKDHPLGSENFDMFSKIHSDKKEIEKDWKEKYPDYPLGEELVIQEIQFNSEILVFYFHKHGNEKRFLGDGFRLFTEPTEENEKNLKILKQVGSQVNVYIEKVLRINNMDGKILYIKRLKDFSGKYNKNLTKFKTLFGSQDEPNFLERSFEALSA